MIVYEGKYTTAKVMINDVEETCAGQIVQFVNHPAFTNPVAVMPDCHAGAGAVIGFTMPMTDKMIPETIGVDIGCGLLSATFDGDLGLSRFTLNEEIRSSIPFGYEVRDSPIYNMERSFPWHIVTQQNGEFVKEFNMKFGTDMKPTSYNYGWFEAKCKQIVIDIGRSINSLGTLGGGKMIASGPRG